MGRQKQPIELLEAKKKSHLTKAEKEERKNSELDAPSDRIEPPDFLTDQEKTRFMQLASELLDLGIMANLDAAALARYVTAETLYETLTRALRRINTDDIDELSKLLTAQDKLFKQCRSSASDLGLTITSRCRIVIPKAEEKTVNPFDLFDEEEECVG